MKIKYIYLVLFLTCFQNTMTRPIFPQLNKGFDRNEKRVRFERACQEDQEQRELKEALEQLKRQREAREAEEAAQRECEAKEGQLKKESMHCMPLSCLFCCQSKAKVHPSC